MRLHQTYVLVRRRVEHDLGPMAAEDVREPALAAYVRDHLVDGQCGMCFAQQVGDVEDAVLAVSEQHDCPRAHARDLAAQLGAYRSAGAGHQHDAAVEVRAGFGSREHGPATEQIGDVDLADPGGVELFLQQFDHAGHGAR